MFVLAFCNCQGLQRMHILEEIISYFQRRITALDQFTVIILNTYSAVNCHNFQPTREVY